MKVFFSLAFTALLSGIFLGCAAREPEKAKSLTKDEKIHAALANLSPEDRKLAEAQKFCAVESHNRLGSMNTPIKIMVDDQPVFLCCRSCEKELNSHKEATLKKAKQLRDANQ